MEGNARRRGAGGPEAHDWGGGHTQGPPDEPEATNDEHEGPVRNFLADANRGDPGAVTAEEVSTIRSAQASAQTVAPFVLLLLFKFVEEYWLAFAAFAIFTNWRNSLVSWRDYIAVNWWPCCDVFKHVNRALGQDAY